MKNVKKILLLAIVVVNFVLGFAKVNPQEVSIFSFSIDASAHSEVIATDVCTEYKSDDVWYNSSGTIVIGEKPSGSTTWTNIVCCCDSDAMTACNFSLEDDDCVRRVTRVDGPCN